MYIPPTNVEGICIADHFLQERHFGGDSATEKQLQQCVHDTESYALLSVEIQR